MLMARQCAFCGMSNKIEAEHVWPHSAAGLFADDGTFTYYRQFVGIGYAAGGPVLVGAEAVCMEGQSRVQVLQQRLDVSQTWETTAKNTLFGSAFGGDGRKLPRGAQRTLAAWALKTTMMVEAHQMSLPRRGSPRRVPAPLGAS